MRTYLADLHYMDPATNSPGVLRFATVGYVTQPTDTPANAVYRERLRQPATLARHAFQEAATFGRSTLSYGEIELTNGDGDLDVLRTYGFDGQRVVIRAGDSAAAFAALVTILTGTVEGCEVGRSVVRVRIRSRELVLLVPLQPNKYAGNNVLPDGLEGTADDLKGKPKPLCFGVVTNVPAVLVNSAKLIYQVHDGPISSVDMVYDKGIALLGRGEFTARTGGFASSVFAVAFSGSLFLAAGSSDDVATSPDGITWTQRTTGHGTATWRAVAYGAGLWVIAGHTGVLYTSPDGITWTSRTSTFGASNIYGLCFGGDQFVAVGEAGKIATSPDGITWTAQTSLGGAVIINCVARGGTLFVLGTDTGVIYTSPTGVTWTSRTSSSGDSIKAITFAQGYYIAVGGNGTGSARIATSVDGLIWFDRANPFGTNQLLAVGWGPGEFVVGGTGKIGLSPDGTIWSEFTNPFGAEEVYGVAFGDVNYGTTVIVGDANNVASTYATAVEYADEAELLDDSLAPAPARYKVWPEGGYFRLGALPAGLITADVTEGGNAKMRSPSYVFRRMLWQPWVVGGPFLLWRETDLEDWYTAFAHVMGFWTADEITIAQALDLVAMTSGNWWGSDKTGKIRTAQFTAPSGSSVLDINENQVIDLERLPAADITRGIPPWRSIVRWGRLYVVQATDVAGGVTDARRGELAKEWREAKAEDATVKIVHLLAPQVVEDSLLATEAGAQAEATRRQTLRGTQRDVFQFRVQLNAATEALELGDVVDLTHSRFGLTGGELCRVIGVDPDAREQRTLLTVFK